MLFQCGWHLFSELRRAPHLTWPLCLQETQDGLVMKQCHEQEWPGYRLGDRQASNKDAEAQVGLQCGDSLGLSSSEPVTHTTSAPGILFLCLRSLMILLQFWSKKRTTSKRRLLSSAFVSSNIMMLSVAVSRGSCLAHHFWDFKLRCKLLCALNIILHQTELHFLERAAFSHSVID